MRRLALGALGLRVLELALLRHHDRLRVRRHLLHVRDELGGDLLARHRFVAELVPYLQLVAPNAQAIVESQQREFEHAQAKRAERQPVHELLAAMATATTFDPTGASKRAYAAAEMAQMAKERGEDAAEAASPEAQKSKAQREQMAAQAQAMQGDVRLQRLLQLGQQKGCDRKR